MCFENGSRRRKEDPNPTTGRHDANKLGPSLLPLLPGICLAERGFVTRFLLKQDPKRVGASGIHTLLRVTDQVTDPRSAKQILRKGGAWEGPGINGPKYRR